MSQPKTEVSDPVVSLRQLCAGMGDVLDHPIVRVVVEFAPSPTAAAEYLRDLGWGGDDVTAARKAAQVKRDYPDSWPAVLGFLTRPFERAFQGAAMPSQFFSVVVGDRVVPDDRPLPALLREYEIHQVKSVFTTVDLKGLKGPGMQIGRSYPGGALLNAVHDLDGDWAGWMGHASATATRSDQAAFSLGTGQGTMPIWKIDYFQRTFLTRWVMTTPTPECPIPQVYKAVLVEDYDTKSPGKVDTIRCLYRVDLGSKHTDSATPFGWVEFRARRGSTTSAAGVYGTFSRRFLIERNHQLNPVLGRSLITWDVTPNQDLCTVPASVLAGRGEAESDLNGFVTFFRDFPSPKLEVLMGERVIQEYKVPLHQFFAI